LAALRDEGFAKTKTSSKEQDRPLQVHQQTPAVSPNVAAGILLYARQPAKPLKLACPSGSEVLAATGASRSRAYEIADQVCNLLPTLSRPPGRPPTEPTPVPRSGLEELRGQALRFVMGHPGCVSQRGRSRYAAPWRRFVLAAVERHADASLPEIADALCMPLGTLEDWLRTPPSAAPESAPDAPQEVERDAKLALVETVLDAWHNWHGDFSVFCQHLRRDLRVELGKTTIADILFEHGARRPARRPGRSRDEHAIRGAFDTFFPGAQWVADGKQVEVVIDGEVLHVNLELAVDAASGAAVGINVRDEEDSPALVAAFKDGIATTGEAPLALLVDNRPSNHTPEVDAALGDTMRIDATPGRAQNKAHVEGTFGLFSQKVPALVLDTTDPRALARNIALIVGLTFFRALNRAPRRDRAGRCRVELYAQEVTEEEREAARASLRERFRKQRLARETRAARVDPEVRALLDDVFARLSLLDPERRVRDAIACYPRDAMVDAIAIFETKQQCGTLPDGVDARYLLGIVRNLDHVHEADAITQALLRQRVEARDHFLAGLLRERDDLVSNADRGTTLDALAERLVTADRELDRLFWIDALVLVAPTQQDERHTFARRCARRIHACFALGTHERYRLVRLLLRGLCPIV